MKIQKIATEYYKAKFKLLATFSKKAAGNSAFRLFCTPFGKQYYRLTPVLESAEQLQMEFKGQLLKGYRWNPGGTQKLLIAHGFRSHTQRFDRLIPRLIQKGYCIVAFDAPAHGLSKGKRVNALDYMQLITCLEDQYGPFDSYMAHSFGGLATCLAIAEMEQHPGRKIVLFAPAADALGLAETFLNHLHIADKTVHHHFYNNVVQLSGKALDWFNIKRCIESISGTILWIHDKADKITPVTDAYRIAAMHLPHTQFIFTEGLGHSGIYKNDAVLNEVFAFL